MSELDIDTRDRVIRLETQVEHMSKTMDKMSTQVTELHSMLQQARGAKWVFILVWVGAGGAITYLLQLLKLLGNVK